MTGDWQDAKKRLRASELSNSWRVFRVGCIKDETALIRSLELEPTDARGLIRYLAGQHIPIRIQPAGSEAPLVRTYTPSVSRPRTTIASVSSGRGSFRGAFIS